MTPLEQTIADVAARCVRVNVPIDRDTPFDRLGLDSLATIELAAALEAELGCELPADLLCGRNTARSLADRISRSSAPRAAEDAFEQMVADAVLPDDVRPSERVHASTDLRQARRILVTGATGFLGGAIVSELLGSTTASLVCLTRSGRAPAKHARVDVIDGDLTHPDLGLSQARLEELATGVDAIVHCGAAVNWVFPYEALRSANVLGTLELLRFAGKGGIPFHFISSLSVCYSVDGDPVVDEFFDPIPRLRGVHLGYAQTKVVAEALVREAGARGLPVRIHRPALISGHSVTGAFNRDDLIATLVRGCVAMGTAPDLDWTLDAVPVDVAARAIVALSKERGPVFHIVHSRPRHWRECVLWMRMKGYDVRLVSYPAWLRQLERETKADPRHPLRPLRTFFTQRPSGARGLTLPELYEDRGRTSASAAATQALLDASGVACPGLEASLLDTYFDAFVDAGDLPAVRHPSYVGRAFSSGNDLPGLKTRPTRLPGLKTRPTCELIRDALGARDVEILSTGSDHSIVSELCAWRSRRPSGLFRARATMADGSRRNVVAKIKALDQDVIATGEALADVVDPSVGRAYLLWSDRLGFAASHAREIAIYRQTDLRFVAHVPPVLATVSDDAAGVWMVIQECVRDARLIDSAKQAGAWTPADIAAAIQGLARLQAIWFAREPELERLPWIGHVQSAKSASEMTELWTALARHAAPFFSSWADPDLAGIHQRLVTNIAEWWPVLESSPRTLIHHDFNTRNVCLRGADRRLCAYDWELATIGVPQRDLAEFLCFALTPDVSAEEAAHWIRLHREALVRETEGELDPCAWVDGFRAALSDLLINRLSIYAMVHRIRPQSFLPRVVRTWRELWRHLGETA